MMQVSSSARRFPRVLDRIPVFLRPQLSLISDPVDAVDGLPLSEQWPRPRSFSIQTPRPFVTVHGNPQPSTSMFQQLGHQPLCSSMVRACFSSEANKVSGQPTDIVEELYQKMFKSVEARTMPPNAWLWSLISNSANQEDIKLLFQMLKKLRIFRLSNLRIHANFNCHLCMRVTEACARAGALDYGLKALWKHNVYGLTPTIGSAHYLLLYAKEHNNDKLMVKIMDVLQKNSLPLQPGTADIVFSAEVVSCVEILSASLLSYYEAISFALLMDSNICYNTNKWDLISKYARRFIKAGVKLHRTAFDIWMEFAAKIGDAPSIWKIEKLRANSVKQQTLASGFSCTKGFLLERNPESAAATIHLLAQNLPEKKKSCIPEELQKLISEWPLEMIKTQKKEDKKVLAESLKSDIAAMVTSLLNMGFDVTVDLERFNQLEI